MIISKGCIYVLFDQYLSHMSKFYMNAFLNSDFFTVLKLKGVLREKMVSEPSTPAPNFKAAVQVVVKTPSGKSSPSKAVLTPSVKKNSMKAVNTPAPTPQRIQHKIPHRFINGLNTRATKCGVCLGSVPFVKQAAKCQGWYSI